MLLFDIQVFLQTNTGARSQALRGNATGTLCVPCLGHTKQGTQIVQYAFHAKHAGAWERKGNNYAMKKDS